MSSLQPTVMKFGGTSVGDALAFVRAADLVKRNSACRPVVIVSAMCGFTDALIECVRAAEAGDAGRAALTLEEHFGRHTEVARASLSPAAASEFAPCVAESREEIRATLREVSEGKGPRERLQDSVVSHGERLSAELLAAVLRARGARARCVDARRCVMTDDEHGRATPLKDETERCTREELEPLLEAGEVPVLGG